jgi:hypothetical protein
MKMQHHSIPKPQPQKPDYDGSHGIFAADSLQPKATLFLGFGMNVMHKSTTHTFSPFSLSGFVTLDALAQFLRMPNTSSVGRFLKLPGITMKVLLFMLFAWMISPAESYGQLKITFDKDTLELCEGNSTTIATTITGGRPPYRVVWNQSPNLSDETIERPIVSWVSGMQSYIISVTDNNGIAIQDTVTVIGYRTPTVSAGANETVCIGTTVTLGGQPTAFNGISPYTYQWLFIPSNAINIASPNPTFVADRIGYSDITLNVTDAKGCKGTSKVRIIVNQPLIADAGKDITICAGTPQQIGQLESKIIQGGTAPFRYKWSPEGGLSNPTSPIPAAFPDKTTTYTVSIIDGKGCTITDNVTVNVKSPMTITVKDTTVCANKDVQLAPKNFVTGGVAPFKYKWFAIKENGDPANDVFNDSIETPVVSLSEGRRYRVVVTDAQNCTAQTTLQVRLVQPIATFAPAKDICQKTEWSFALGTESGVTYRFNWSVTGAGARIIGDPNSNKITIIWDSVGASKITLKTFVIERGCEFIAETIMNIKPEPKPVIENKGRAILCPNETTVLDAGPGYILYDWNTGEKTRTITVTKPGSYSVFVAQNIAGSLNCGARSQPVEIKYNETPKPTISGPVKFCEGTSVTLVTESGLARYLWNVPSNNSLPTLTVNTPGTFKVQVWDSIGCPGESKVHSTEFNPIQLDYNDNGNSVFSARETELDYPPQGITFRNIDDDDLTIERIILQTTNPLVDELYFSSFDIDGRVVNDLRGQVLKPGQRLNIGLKFSPLVPDTVLYKLQLIINSPCALTYQVTIQTQSYDKRITTTTRVKDVFAKVGAENVKIPVWFSLAKSQDSIVGAKLTMRMKFNSRLYLPQSITNGTIIKRDTLRNGWHHLWIQFDNLVVKYDAPVLLTEVVGRTLATTYFTDSVFVDNMSWTNVLKEPRVSIFNGLITLEPYCFPRDVNFIGGDPQMLLSIQPNPVRNDAGVKLVTNIPGTFKFDLYNQIGVKISSKEVLVKSEVNDIHHFDTSQLPNGVYPMVISTPTHVEILNIVVEK